MLVETWADVVCPWCYIGKARLGQVMDSSAEPFEALHRAFQLDPGARTEGRPTIDVLAEKYGATREQAHAMMRNVSQVAESVGLEFHLDRTLSGNTADAHRTVLWAQESDADVASRLLNALYSAYFTRGEPIFTPDDIAPHAEACGLDPSAMRAMLASGGFADEVRSEQAQASAMGATGVPFFVFDRKLAVSGAQPAEVLRQAIEQASA